MNFWMGGLFEGRAFWGGLIAIVGIFLIGWHKQMIKLSQSAKFKKLQKGYFSNENFLVNNDLSLSSRKLRFFLHFFIEEGKLIRRWELIRWFTALESDSIIHLIAPSSFYSLGLWASGYCHHNLLVLHIQVPFTLISIDWGQLEGS